MLLVEAGVPMSPTSSVDSGNSYPALSLTLSSSRKRREKSISLELALGSAQVPGCAT